MILFISFGIFGCLFVLRFENQINEKIWVKKLYDKDRNRCGTPIVKGPK